MTLPQPEPRPQLAPPPPPGAARQDGGRLGLVLLLAGVVLLGVLGGWAPLVVVVALFVMIAMHELGHYLTARWSGMAVTEFFIGFGPRIWSTRRGETEYGIKAVPLGAYVKIPGMSNLEQVDPADEERTYRAKSYPRRLSVGLAGSAMHFLMAIALLYALLVGWGLPSEDRYQVGEVSAGSPAQQAGLEVGDRIVAVDGVEVDRWEAVRDQLRSRPGDTVTLTVERDGDQRDVQATLEARNPDSGEPVGFLGVANEYGRETLSPVAAAPRAVSEFGSLSWQTLKGLGSFLWPPNLVETLGGRFFEDEEQAGEPAGGGTGAGGGEEIDDNRVLSPVGAVGLGADLAREGFAPLLFFLVAINIFVGFFNLVPLPPFDGGHVAVATYERLRSRPGRRYQVDMAKLLPVAYTVVALLGVLFLTGLWSDITDPIQLR